jgi:hypothetical protein
MGSMIFSLALQASAKRVVALYISMVRRIACCAAPVIQGLTLVHFAAQLEPCLTQKITLHTLNTPCHPLNTGYTTPTRTPYPIQSAQVELKSERV